MSGAAVTRLRELCEQLVQRAESDPAGAGALADAVATLLDSDASTKVPGRRGGRRPAPVLDPFEIHRQDPDALARRLGELNLEQLRDVVAHYGMDPRRLVMKWKTQERVVAHIVETVQARSRKGDAFRGTTVKRGMTKTALGSYDHRDEWRGVIRNLGLPQQQWRKTFEALQMPQTRMRETLKALQMPQTRMRETLKSLQLPDTQMRETLRALQMPNSEMRETLKSLQLPDTQMRETLRALQMPNSKMRETLRALQMPRIDDQQWRAVLEASRLPQAQVRETLRSVQILQQQWRDVIEATRMPDLAWRELIEAPRLPLGEWQQVLHDLREAAVSAVGEAAESFEAELETAEPVADPDRASTSWLLNLTFVKQVGLLVVALEVLDTWSQWLVVTFSDEELPPELTQTTRLLFALIGALMIVIRLRAGVAADDDEE